jgi:hypothetical protein
VLTEDEILDGVGGFLIAGPILEPLELLLLAGTLVIVFDDLFTVEGLLGTSNDLFEVVAAEEFGMDGFIGIFFTVFVETALFNDERELLKLARELLLSTSNLLFAIDEIVGFGTWFGCSGLRNEFVLRGVDEALLVPLVIAVVLNDLLLSRDC